MSGSLIPWPSPRIDDIFHRNIVVHQRFVNLAVMVYIQGADLQEGRRTNVFQLSAR